MRVSNTKEEFRIEAIVGAFIVMILLGLGYFTIILGRTTFLGAKKTEMEIVFKDIMGLRKEDNVVVRGMNIGKVSSLKLQADGVHVVAVLDQQLHMRKDYKISVVTTSALGGRHLQIVEGSAEQPEIALRLYNGAEPFDLMADAAEFVNALKKGAVDGGMIDNLRDASAQLKEITTRIAKGEGTLGKLLSKDDQVYNDLAATAASFKNISGKIEKGEGMLGKLVNDDHMYKDLEKTIKEVRATVDDYRETMPVVTFSSVFFGAF